MQAERQQRVDGVTRPVLHSDPQTMVRAYVVEVVTATGQHRYIVAIDIDAGAPR
jgi:hypothetical protein